MSEKVRPFIHLSWTEASFTMKKINYDWGTFQHMHAAAVNSSNENSQGFIIRQRALPCSALLCSINIAFLPMLPHLFITNSHLRCIIHPKMYNLNITIQLYVLGFPFFFFHLFFKASVHTQTHFYSSLPSHLPFSTWSLCKSLCGP